MPLLTPELKARIPGLYSQENNPDPIVQVMIHGANGWLWAITEYSDEAPDGCPHLAFGLVLGFEMELGYIHLDELDEINVDYLSSHPFAWVDETFVPKPLSEVRGEMDAIQDRLTLEMSSGQRFTARIVV